MKKIISFNSEGIRLLKTIQHSAKDARKEVFLVGGILRDMLLGIEKDNPDFDFCLRKGAVNFGRRLSGKIKSGFVVLDQERGICRLVKKVNNHIYTFDFNDFRADNLKKDLLHRDFTINAMAVPLGDFLSGYHEGKPFKDSLIDPYGGREDLRRRIIRAVNKKTFDEDPLRILRAFSFAAKLGFSISKDTLVLIKSKAKKVTVVSPERVRDELFKILDNHSAFNYLKLLDKFNILEFIFPQIKKMRGVSGGPYHHLDVYKHSLETLKQMDSVLYGIQTNTDIADYLNSIISSDRKRRQILKLSALLHDIGKPDTFRRIGRRITFHGHERTGSRLIGEIGLELKLSREEISSLKNIVLWHLRPGYLADNQKITERAIFRFFRDAKDDTISILLLSIADQRATRGRLNSRLSRRHHEDVSFSLIREYFRRKKEKKIMPLVNGDIIMREFKLKPSVLVGRILFELEEAQAIGQIKSRPEALKLARKLLKSIKTLP